jgi:hypothetical protein
MINLTPIFQAIISLIAALIAYRLIPYIKAHTSEKQQALLQSAIEIAVYAAEQIYGAGHGEEKLEYASIWLQDRGYHVDRSEIEACVYNALNWNKGKKPEAENAGGI